MALHEIRPSSPCPCTSGAPYRDCCQPVHKGQRVAATPSEMLRARYAAYAVGDIDFLWKTLHPGHEDRALPEGLAREGLRDTARSFKYTGLTIHEEQIDGDSGTVRFFAKVFTKGRDCSFGETSLFERTADGWQYRSGDVKPGVQK